MKFSLEGASVGGGGGGGVGRLCLGLIKLKNSQFWRTLRVQGDVFLRASFSTGIRLHSSLIVNPVRP